MPSELLRTHDIRMILSWVRVSGSPRRSPATKLIHSHAKVVFQGDFDLRAWAVLAVAFLQVILVSAHWFIYGTLVSFWPPFLPMTPVGLEYLRGALFLLSISFIIAAVLGYRY